MLKIAYKGKKKVLFSKPLAYTYQLTSTDAELYLYLPFATYIGSTPPPPLYFDKYRVVAELCLYLPLATYMEQLTSTTSTGMHNTSSFEDTLNFPLHSSLSPREIKKAFDTTLSKKLIFCF